MLTPCILLFFLLFPGPGDEEIITASSFAGRKYPPKFAFDRDPSTRWSADFKERSGWIQIIYAKEKTVDRVSIQGEGEQLKGMPGALRIMYLKDDKWRSALIHENKKGPKILLELEPVTSRGFKLIILDVVNPKWSPTISELDFFSSMNREEPAPTQKKERPKVTASGSRSEKYSPKMACDQIMGTCWQAPNKAKSGWIQFTFPKAVVFNFMTYDVETESGYGAPKDFSLQVKKGKKWRSIFSKKNHIQQNARIPFKKTSSDQWRLKVDDVINARYGLRLSEIRFSLEEDPKAMAIQKNPPPSAPGANKIKQAIQNGQKFLLKTQRKDGNWDCAYTDKYPAGVSALGALALLKSGLKSHDPKVSMAVNNCLSHPFKSVYSVALILLALDEAGPAPFHDKMEKAAKFLIETQSGEGLWGYPGGRPDHSNTQYALLGLHAAARSNIKIPEEIWFKTGRAFLRSQLKGGGWNYVVTGKQASDPPTGSMTAAGLACLRLCALHSKKLSKKETDQATLKAFDWLGAHLTVNLNPGSQTGLGHYYYLYGLERAGKFFNRPLINGRSWYSEGSAHLVKFQRKDGGWQNDFVDTCFAILFLTQSSWPLTGK